VGRTQAKRKRAYHHGDLRSALIDASLEVIGREGIDGLTIRRVSERVGVTPGAAYHHFQSKKHLMAAAAERGFAELLSEQTEADRAAGPHPLGRLEALGRVYIRYALGHPAHYRVMFGEHTRQLDMGDPAPSGRQVWALLLEVSRACADAAEAQIDATDLARTAWATVSGVVSLILEREVAPDPSAADVTRLTDMAMAVLIGGLNALASNR